MADIDRRADVEAVYHLGEQAGPGIEIVRVEYDLERAVEGILASELPAAFADELRAGGGNVPG